MNVNKLDGIMDDAAEFVRDHGYVTRMTLTVDSERRYAKMDVFESTGDHLEFRKYFRAGE